MDKRAKEAEIKERRKHVRRRFRILTRIVILNKAWLEDTEEQQMSMDAKKNIDKLLRPKRKIGILTMNDKKIMRTPFWMRPIEDRKHMINLMLNLTCFAKFKPDTNMYEEKLQYILAPGDCIGDIAFLEHCRRIQTCKARNDVELLTISEEDFEKILRTPMEELWQEKKLALAAFDYFKDWNLQQKIFACKVGLLKQYEPLETIYYEDKGPLTYVHFVISGECMIVQCLKMKVTEKRHKKSYSLLDIQEGDTTLPFRDMTKEQIFKKLVESKIKGGARLDVVESDDKTVNSSSDSEEDDQEEEEVPGVYKKARKSFYKEFAHKCGVDVTGYNKVKEDSVFDLIPNLVPVTEKTSEKRLTAKFLSSQRRSSTVINKLKEELNSNIESHLIDVGSLTYGGIFGLGEQLQHRVIMARTTVQCLLIPRFWLFEKDQNPGNIWQRMRFYIDSTIPSRELLFKDFLATRKWQQLKKKLIDESLDKTKVGNPTKVQDIPIICRITEANGDDDNST
ncbi:uncharacterized protein LOC129949437 isoform X2 [Eupeodes corollae]|uniref:uncharacterized protein LOC129949437 isoform X2 n=1 Tax=Eupeodes corollae TaxID=290404 RepID=UPI0024915A1E|nr:uncharacterized protein LOC129949437 isoform X2 [Eupeodes corollae]